ncbi:hypothetical protein [Microbacterium aurantiacum]|uniref:hypothetical protein n=1 Tax=Microbacterium aurantiacum TaxID=162393 RepID=UPI0012E218BB|nr:hypothetical protein [Microbacterium chocolatum]
MAVESICRVEKASIRAGGQDVLARGQYLPQLHERHARVVHRGHQRGGEVVLVTAAPPLVEGEPVPRPDREDLRVPLRTRAAPDGVPDHGDRIAPPARGPEELDRQHGDHHRGEHPPDRQSEERHGDRTADGEDAAGVDLCLFERPDRHGSGEEEDHRRDDDRAKPADAHVEEAANHPRRRDREDDGDECEDEPVRHGPILSAVTHGGKRRPVLRDQPLPLELAASGP